MNRSLSYVACALLCSSALTAFGAQDTVGVVKVGFKNGNKIVAIQPPSNTSNGFARGALAMVFQTGLLSVNESRWGNNNVVVPGTSATASADADTNNQALASSGAFAARIARFAAAPTLSSPSTFNLTFNISNTTLTGLATCGYSAYPGGWGSPGCQITYATGSSAANCYANLASGATTGIGGSNSYTISGLSFGTYGCAYLNDYHVQHEVYPSGAVDQDIETRQEYGDTGYLAYGTCTNSSSCSSGLF